MVEKRFDPAKLEKLNNPERIVNFPLDLVIQKTKLDNPRIMIDLGAGTGFFSIPFAEKFPWSKIYACDISEVMIDWMTKNVSVKYKNIIPFKMDESSISLENGYADFLFMVNLHHELDFPEKTLQECYRLLKHQGKIAISDWKKEESEKGPPIELRYKPEVIKEQLLKVGFVNILIDIDLPDNFLLIGEKE